MLGVIPFRAFRNVGVFGDAQPRSGPLRDPRREPLQCDGEAMSLRQRGRRDEAHATLAEIYGWFTEGFDTADLKDAKALFDELKDN